MHPTFPHRSTRRQFVGGLLASAALGSRARALQDKPAPTLPPGLALTPPPDILARVEAARPSRGAPIPADLRDRLGSAHVAAKYFFSQKPILVEGAERILQLGSRVGKFWLGKLHETYTYHCDWSDLPRSPRLVDFARHPHYAAVLAMPFSTIALEVETAPGTRLFHPKETYTRDEEQIHELAAHLLRAYRDHDRTFILQNWEGDWLVRATQRDWSKGVPDDGLARMRSMGAWWRARQRGVERARQGQPAGCRCRVLHAAEVVRVTDTLKGIPNLATHVLPETPVDLVSWSSYEGMGDPVTAWHCLDVLRHCGRKAGGGPVPLMIGEIGLPEQGRHGPAVTRYWDTAMAVLFARDIPLILQWALYCNEPLDRKKDDPRPRKIDELKGFWWIRPDGSLSWGGQYLSDLLTHAGRKLPNTPEG